MAVSRTTSAGSPTEHLQTTQMTVLPAPLPARPALPLLHTPPLGRSGGRAARAQGWGWGRTTSRSVPKSRAGLARRRSLTLRWPGVTRRLPSHLLRKNLG